MFSCCSIYAVLKLVWLSTQWAELKAILITLVNTPFDENFFFFFTDPWDFANDLANWSTIWPATWSMCRLNNLGISGSVTSGPKRVRVGTINKLFVP